MIRACERARLMYPVRVHLHAALRPLNGGRRELLVSGRSVRDVLDALCQGEARFRAALLDERGELRRYVTLFVNEEDVRLLRGLDTHLDEGDELFVLSSVCGG